MDNTEFIMDERAIVPDMKCNVCGETEFDLQEGYYNCRECGTVAEQVRLIEVEEGADHEAGRFGKKTTIKAKVENELKLTSWECYNYILRGFVEELVMFGAKEELKLMTLQIWAAYLRRMEVAFFNKKHAELPHLGVLYHEKDAEILYNQQRKKRKRRHTSDSITSGEISGRSYRKSLRKLDESMYSIASQTDESSMNTSFRTSENSLSTDTTSRAIHIQFSNAAKKVHKIKHKKQPNLRKQTGDGNSSTINPVKIFAKELKISTKVTHTLNIKQLYGILAISLNLIEDDIQLSDLTRFIADDHISTKNVTNYFPENLRMNIKNILNDIKFFQFPDKFNYEFLREHVSYLRRFLNISEFKMPNIVSLIERYITELDLPEYLAMLIKRLINLLPPNMCTRRNQMYPPFEARAMAYIVFVLKLLFGLDGEKEKLISQSAKKINEKLHSLSTDKSKPIHADLFVWDEWVQYIEMRKMILSQVNINFAQQFGYSELKTELFIAKLQRDEECKDDEDLEFNTSNVNNTKKMNIRTIFSNLLSKLSKKINETEAFTMKPNFTPAHTYLQRILLNNSNSNDRFFSNPIPTFMHVNHGQRDIESFLCGKTLQNCLAKHEVRLNVESLSCNSNKEFVGIFYMVPANKSQILKADFNISEEDWKKNINANYKLDDLDFKTEYDSYNANYIYQLKKKYGSNFEISTKKKDRERKKHLIKTESTSHENLNEDNIFTDMSNDNNIENVNQIQEERSMTPETPLNEENAKNGNIMTLHTSEMDYWELLGYSTTLALMTDTQKQNFSAKFPLSFFWLLETCAQTIQVDWPLLYEQLLTIEVMFGHGLKNLDTFTNCLHYKYDIMIKDIAVLVNQYRDIW